MGSNLLVGHESNFNRLPPAFFLMEWSGKYQVVSHIKRVNIVIVSGAHTYTYPCCHDIKCIVVGCGNFCFLNTRLDQHIPNYSSYN